MEINLSDITQKVCTLTRDVALFIRTESQTFHSGKIEYKGRYNNLVSYVDKEAEMRLVHGLGNILPGSGFVGEEGANEAGTNGYKWVIDPLDGTTNFMHGLPVFCISIALVKGEEVVSGVIHEVMGNELFYAWKGGKAWLNDKQIEVSKVKNIGDALIATGFPYSLKGKADDYFKIMKDLVNRSHGIRRMGSAAIDMAYVACGRFDAYFEFNLHSWDIAAGVIIIQEAGGVVTDYSGGKNYLDGNEILVSVPEIHADMLDTIKKYW